MREREEEMERMREHVFRESDTDKNKLISFDEFLAETKREEFEKDPGITCVTSQSLGAIYKYVTLFCYNRAFNGFLHAQVG